MRRHHLDKLQPVCPVCGDAAGLQWSEVSRESAEGTAVDEGVLVCGSVSCRREYPIIGGVPLLITDLRSYVADNILPLTGTSDLSPTIESLLGDCCGAGSVYDSVRRYVSSYAWDHYGDLDPAETTDAEFAAPGAVLRQLEAALTLAGEPLEGPILDVGCGPGRTTLALAERTGADVLGIDMFYPALALASAVVRRGVVRYARRRFGCVYERREFDAVLPARDRVDVWACDATEMPLKSGGFGAIVALNVIDSVADPVALLASLSAQLRPGGRLLLASPYDWSENTTPMSRWIGGHSQRGEDGGDPSVITSRLIAGKLADDLGLERVAEQDDVPWSVRMHERSVNRYRTHLVVARKTMTG